MTGKISYEDKKRIQTLVKCAYAIVAKFPPNMS